jgi:hypothetical protein
MMTRRQVILRLFTFIAAPLAMFRPGRTTVSVPPPAGDPNRSGVPWVSGVHGR